MKICNISGETIYEDSCETLVATVVAAVKARQSLTGADLTGAYLRNADLRGAFLRGAYLRNADLSGADLTGAFLGRADLREADLTRADLRRADLRNADLRGADLREAFLEGADLSDAKGILVFVGGRDLAVAFSHKDVVYVRIGCLTKTLADWLLTYETVGQKHDYSEAEIRKYAMFLKGVDSIKETYEDCIRSRDAQE